MGKARKGLSRKRNKASFSRNSNTVAATTVITSAKNENESKLYDYESFPIIPGVTRSRSRSRSSSPIKRQEKDAKPLTTPSNRHESNNGTIEFVEDPGNPLGNAVDFCVNKLHASSVDMSCSKFVLKPCQDNDIQQILEAILLCDRNKLEGHRKTNENANTYANTYANVIDTSPTIETTETETDFSTADSYTGSSAKRSKHGCAKDAMVVPGRKLSVCKEEQCSNENHTSDDDQSLVWKGIIEEDDPEVDDIITISISCQSDEDTLFSKLEHESTCNLTGSPPLQEGLIMDSEKVFVSKEKKFVDEGTEPNSDKRAGDTYFSICLSASSLCARPTLSRQPQDGVFYSNNIFEKGDMVIPRDLKEDESAGTSTNQTSANWKTKIKIAATPYSENTAVALDNSDEDEAKVEFEMILDDSRFGNRKWGAITLWKKIESFGASSYGGGKRRRRSNRSLSNGSQILNLERSLADSFDGKSAPRPTSPEHQELVLDDAEPRLSPTDTSQKSSRIFRKRRLQSAFLGFSAKSRRYYKRASATFNKRAFSWKKMMLVPASPWREQRSSDDSFTNGGNLHTEKTVGGPASKEGDKSEESLQYSESDEEITAAIAKQSDCKIAETKELSSTPEMGQDLHKWSWGVFNRDHRKEKGDDAENLGNIPLFGPMEEYDSATDYTAQDVETYYNDDDTNHDGWIMNEDQLESFSEEDDSRKTGNSDSYTSTNGSITSCTDFDDECEHGSDEETIDSKSFHGSEKLPQKMTFKNSTISREGFLALSKSIRKSFTNEKKKRKMSIDVSIDICINAESCDEKGITANDTSMTIEAVLLTKGIRPPFFQSFKSLKRSPSRKSMTIPSEDRDDSCSRNDVRQNRFDGRIASNDTGFSKAKNFWKQQSSSMKPPRFRTQSHPTKLSSRIVDSTSGSFSSRSRYNVIKSTGTSMNAGPDPALTYNGAVTVEDKPKKKNDVSQMVATTFTSSTMSTILSKNHLHEYRPDQNQISQLDMHPYEEDKVDYGDENERDSLCEESTASSSTCSRSCSRDDNDTQLEDFFYGFDFFRSNEVIRE